MKYRKYQHMKNPSKYSKGSTGVSPVVSSVSPDTPRCPVTSYRSLVTKLTIHILAAAILSFASLGAQEPLTKPQNYDEIRPLLSNYVSTQGIRKDINEALFSQGEAALPTLFFLFEEGKQIDRFWLVRAIDGCSHSKEAKTKVADFLTKQIESTNFENERDLSWIAESLGFFVETDPERARHIAWKLLNTPKPSEPGRGFSMLPVMVALGETGTMEDVERLKDWAAQRKIEIKGWCCENAIELIKLRHRTKPQDYSDIRAMLKEWLKDWAWIRPMRHIDEKLLEARESFRVKGDDPFQVFLFLFESNTDDLYRSGLLDATDYGVPGRMAQVADFLAKRLEGTDVEQWDGEKTISRTFWTLEGKDNERAKRLAKKALNSPKQEIQKRAIRVYREVGTLEDVETVRNWYVRQAKSEGRSEGEQLEAGNVMAERMKESIKSREERARQREEKEKEKK